MRDPTLGQRASGARIQSLPRLRVLRGFALPSAHEHFPVGQKEQQQKWGQNPHNEKSTNHASESPQLLPQLLSRLLICWGRRDGGEVQPTLPRALHPQGTHCPPCQEAEAGLGLFRRSLLSVATTPTVLTLPGHRTACTYVSLKAHVGAGRNASSNGPRARFLPGSQELNPDWIPGEDAECPK